MRFILNRFHINLKDKAGEVACVGNAETRDRTGDLQIFSLTLSQLSYRGIGLVQADPIKTFVWEHHSGPPQFLPRRSHVYISPPLDFATIRAPRTSNPKEAVLDMTL